MPKWNAQLEWTATDREKGNKTKQLEKQQHKSGNNNKIVKSALRAVAFMLVLLCDHHHQQQHHKNCGCHHHAISSLHSRWRCRWCELLRGRELIWIIVLPTKNLQLIFSKYNAYFSPSDWMIILFQSEEIYDTFIIQAPVNNVGNIVNDLDPR